VEEQAWKSSPGRAVWWLPGMSVPIRALGFAHKPADPADLGAVSGTTTTREVDHGANEG